MNPNPDPVAPPNGYKLIKRKDPIKEGDIFSDHNQQWRGPLPADHDFVGKTSIAAIPNSFCVARKIK